MTAWQDEALECIDPDCDGIAEPEADGDVRWHECLDCGHGFNFRRVEQPLTAQPAGHCAVGIPEAVRRRASLAPTPLLQIGRRPDA